jgi:hypothetical protein
MAEDPPQLVAWASRRQLTPFWIDLFRAPLPN